MHVRTAMAVAPSEGRRFLKLLLCLPLVATFAGVYAGCAAAAAYPPVPEVGDHATSSSFEKLVQHAVVETRTVDRVKTLAELTTFLPKDANDDVGRQRFATYIIECYRVSMKNGDYARWKEITPEVQRFVENFPRETVVLGLTQESDWVRTLYRERGAIGALEKSGALDTVGINPFQSFLHVRKVLNYQVRQQVWESDEYDHLIGFMYAKDPLAAGCDLLHLGMPTNLSPESDLKAVNSARTGMAEIALATRAAAYSYEQTSQGLPAMTVQVEPDAKLRETVRRLARRPEWSIQVFILRQMNAFPTLYDPLAKGLIVKQNNPVTRRLMPRSVAETDQSLPASRPLERERVP